MTDLVPDTAHLEELVEMVRPQRLAENVVFIDGFSSSGKSLIAPILSSLHRSELWRLDHNFEFLCTLDHLRQMDRRAATMMVKLHADLALYNLMIGRNINFREGDESGAPANLQVERYRARLFERDGDRVTHLIQESNPNLFIMTHWILPMSEVLWEALQERLRLFIVCVRHPFWQIEAWFKGDWEARVGRDPRDFQPCYKRNGLTFPWYASEWELEHGRLSRLERAIQHVASYSRGCEEFCRRRSVSERNRVMFVPFEPFTQDPAAYLGQLASCLDTKETDLTSLVFEKVGVPRKYPAGYLQSKKQEVEQLLRSENVSEEYTTLLQRLSYNYENKYLAGTTS